MAWDNSEIKSGIFQVIHGNTNGTIIGYSWDFKGILRGFEMIFHRICTLWII